MTGKEGNGGNGGGKIETVVAIKKTLEEKHEALIEAKKGQYFLMRLIKILGIKPLKKKDVSSPRWVTISLEGLNYDLTEICEKAIDNLEIFRKEKTKK